MTIKEKPVFITDDGVSHDSREEAELHEKVVAVKAEADEFAAYYIKTHGLSGRLEASISAKITEYVTWKLKGKPAAVAPEKKEKAAAPKKDKPANEDK